VTSLLAIEILKTCARWRTYIGFIAIGVLVPLVEIGLKWEGGSLVRGAAGGLTPGFVLPGNIFNGYFVTYIVMNSLWIHIPFLIALVAGDQLAGEAGAGTFRVLLIRPPSRARILFAKFLTSLLYTLSLVTFLALLSIGLGIALLGTGDLIVPGKNLVIIPEADVPWRLAAAFGLATLSMWCVASLALLFSSLVQNAVGPIIGTMAVIIVFLVISTTPVELFAALRPYLFTTYGNVWQLVFAEPVPWREVGWHALYLGLYTIGFYLATWYLFATKDILG
jgi:ABC-2 type transport system permease protein